MEGEAPPEQGLLPWVSELLNVARPAEQTAATGRVGAAQAGQDAAAGRTAFLLVHIMAGTAFQVAGTGATLIVTPDFASPILYVAGSSKPPSAVARAVS